MIDVEMLRPTADEMLSGLSCGKAMRSRIQFQAHATERLAQIAGETLSGLHATPALRHRILVVAERRKPALAQVRPSVSGKPLFARLLPAMSMAVVLTLVIGLGFYYGGRQPPISQAPTIENGYDTFSAGSGNGPAASQYRSLLAGEDTNPPLICVNGRYYRMLESPNPVSASLIETAIGEVQSFTEEPALAVTLGVMSNVVPVGGKIYSIAGISQKTACLAEVNGMLRAFQRVGYASETILGNEMFQDTLAVNGMVETLELSGVGIIDNEVTANELIYMLYEFAVYHSNEIASGEQALTIYLKNGLSLQLTVQEDVLGGCGAWACPQFFEVFAEKIS